MKVPRIYKVATLVVVFIAALTLLAVMSLKVYSSDYSEYFELRDFVRKLKQYDTGWNIKIVNSRISASDNFLFYLPDELNKRWADLDEITRSNGLSGLWADRREKYMIAVQNKKALVDQFKEHNKALREGLVSLSNEADSVQQLLKSPRGQESTQYQALSSDVLDVTLTLLECEIYKTDERCNEVEAQSKVLGEYLSRLSFDDQKHFKSFLVLVNSILQERPVVEDLLARIGFIPVTQTLDSINELLNESQRRAESKSRQYQYVLIICASIMAFLMVYLALRLKRSYKIIHRVNRELQSANECLEQRVEERTRALLEAERELVDAARMSGMAEIANNVLHSVGNVLNSVNVSAEVIARKLSASKTLGLGRAVNLMNEHAQDLGQFLTLDEKGKLLPHYLSQLVEAVAVEQSFITKELTQLTKSIDHIKDIVSTQQAYAGAARLIEPINVIDLFEDALRMNSDALARHDIIVIKDYQDVPNFIGDKHRLLLILINLISNAKQAMSNVVGHQREIILSVSIITNAKLRFSVRDRGEGITAENISMIFNHGFTTRKDGHGFGLHSCAIAAVEMNGHLTVHSDGPGLGAIFTLEIPLVLVDGPRIDNPEVNVNLKLSGRPVPNS